jgi:hypothetical protein
MFTFPICHFSGEKAFPVVEATSTGSQSSGAHTVNFPAGYSTGDLIIINFGVYGNSDVNTPSGWTVITNQDNPNSTQKTMYRVLTGSEGSGVSVTTTVSTYTAYTCYRISGASGNVEGTPTGTSGTLINPPSHTASWGATKNLWIAAGAEYSFTAVQSAPTNYNNNFIQAAWNSGSIDWQRTAMGSYEYETTATQNPGAFTGTLSGGYAWCGATLVVEPQ